MRKILFVLALATATFTSCSKNDSETIIVGTNEEDKFIGTWKGEKTVIQINPNIEEDAPELEECEKNVMITFEKKNGTYYMTQSDECNDDDDEIPPIIYTAINGRLGFNNSHLSNNYGFDYKFNSPTELTLEIQYLFNYKFRFELTKQ